MMNSHKLIQVLVVLSLAMVMFTSSSAVAVSDERPKRELVVENENYKIYADGQTAIEKGKTTQISKYLIIELKNGFGNEAQSKSTRCDFDQKLDLHTLIRIEPLTNQEKFNSKDQFEIEFRPNKNYLKENKAMFRIKSKTNRSGEKFYLAINPNPSMKSTSASRLLQTTYDTLNSDNAAEVEFPNTWGTGKTAKDISLYAFMVVHVLYWLASFFAIFGKPGSNSAGALAFVLTFQFLVTATFFYLPERGLFTNIFEGMLDARGKYTIFRDSYVRDAFEFTYKSEYARSHFTLSAQTIITCFFYFVTVVLTFAKSPYGGHARKALVIARIYPTLFDTCITVIATITAKERGILLLFGSAIGILLSLTLTIELFAAISMAKASEKTDQPQSQQAKKTKAKKEKSDDGFGGDVADEKDYAEEIIVNPSAQVKVQVQQKKPDPYKNTEKEKQILKDHKKHEKSEEVHIRDPVQYDVLFGKFNWNLIVFFFAALFLGISSLVREIQIIIWIVFGLIFIIISAVQVHNLFVILIVDQLVHVLLGLCLISADIIFFGSDLTILKIITILSLVLLGLSLILKLVIFVLKATLKVK